MANTYLHPGVYIQELPANNIIEGVSTDVAAFIGIAETGPYDSPQLITSWNQYLSTFGGFIWGRYLAYAVYSFFYQGGTMCYVVRAKPLASGGKGAGSGKATASLPPITITATSEGDWCKDISIRIANYSSLGNGQATGKDAQSNIFILQVLLPTSALSNAGATFAQSILKNYLTINSDSISMVTVDATEYYVLEQFGGFTVNDLANGKNSNFVQVVNNGSIFIQANVSGDGKPSRPSNGVVPFANANPTIFDFNSALSSLDPIVGFSIVAMPDSVSYTTDKTGKTNPVDQLTLIQNLVNTFEQREDAFVVADPPYNISYTDIVNFKEASGNFSGGNALTSSYGAIYYPWITISQPSNGMNILVPPSGAVAGCYAATDQSVGVYKAAAGITDGKLNIAVDLETIITDTQQDVLNPAGINAIRSFQKYGITIWGARTFAVDPAWQYVSVRRLMIFIEMSIYQGIQWVVFEPNDQTLWAAVTRDISAFLTTQWNEGALFGSTASEAFSVVCNSTNNTPDTIELGYLYVDVAIAPVRPAEFVVIRIQQPMQTTTSSTS